jgi:serine/threonine protein kinase
VTSRTLTQLYTIDKKLIGQGVEGKVFKATNKADPTIEVALKVISKIRMGEAALEQLNSEIQIMQNLDHPNIVEYYECYDDRKYKYLCMELVQGEELLDHVLKLEEPLTECDCAGFVNQLVKAL